MFVVFLPHWEIVYLQFFGNGVPPNVGDGVPPFNGDGVHLVLGMVFLAIEMVILRFMETV